MLRRALTIAAWAGGLEIVLNLSPSVQIVARYGWQAVPTLALPVSLMILLPLLRVLFLVALLREASGTASAGTRQLYAFAAMTGEVLKLLFMIGEALNLQFALGTVPSFVSYRPAQYWFVLIGLRILPSLCWIGLLWMFWRDASPLRSKYTRGLAGILCVVEVLRGLRGSYTMAARLSRIVASLNWHVWDFVAPVISVAAWASLAFVLFIVYRQGLGDSRTERV